MRMASALLIYRATGSPGKASKFCLGKVTPGSALNSPNNSHPPLPLTQLCLELNKSPPLIPPKAAGAAQILLFHPSLGLGLQLGLHPQARTLLAMQSLHQMAPGGTCHLLLLLPDGWVTAQPARGTRDSSEPSQGE